MKTIKDEVKANTASVQSDLGSGANGHLGLVTTPAEYTSISLVQYLWHNSPGILVIDPGTATYKSTQLQEVHKEALCLYQEMLATEKALQQ